MTTASHVPLGEIDIMALCAQHGYAAEPIYLDDDVNLLTWGVGLVLMAVCGWELFLRICLGRVHARKSTLRELQRGRPMLRPT